MNAVAGGHFAVRGTPKNDPIRPLKFIENQWFYNSFQPFAALKIRFKIRSIFDAILVPTRLHFGRMTTTLRKSGRLMGRLGRVLARLGSVLARLGRVLGASWGRLGGVLGDLEDLGSVLGPS